MKHKINRASDQMQSALVDWMEQGGDKWAAPRMASSRPDAPAAPAVRAASGKTRKRAAGGTQSASAAARLKQLKEEQERGVAPSAGRVTLGSHCQAWMEKIVVNLKPKTQRFYRQMTEHYLLPYLGERKPIKNIDAEDIVDMQNA